MRALVVLSWLGALLALGAGRARAAIDLLADPKAWSSWSARPELAPRFATEPSGDPRESPVLLIQGNGDKAACGCWRRALPPLQKGCRYRIEAAFQAEGVEPLWRGVWAIVAQGQKEFAELTYVGQRDGWRRMALDLAPDENLNGLDLRLYLAWSPAGRVRWSTATLTDITTQPVASRHARLAAISGRPKNPRSPADCLDFYCARLDEAGRAGVDLVVLPEVINTDGIETDNKSALAEPISGPSFNRLAEKARQLHAYVAASLLERDGARLYNTGVLIDRQGSLVGKYHKTHPTIGESLTGGITPGDDFPVFDTDLGRVGYMICFDNHYPEVARTLAVKGAEIIVYSNMADSREKGALWEPYVRTRALDNGVYIVAAVNAKGTCIVSPRGEVVASAAARPGVIARADCPLGVSVRNYSGREIGKRYFLLRRFDLFAPLTQHYADFLEKK